LTFPVELVNQAFPLASPSFFFSPVLRGVLPPLSAPVSSRTLLLLGGAGLLSFFDPQFFLPFFEVLLLAASMPSLSPLCPAWGYLASPPFFILAMPDVLPPLGNGAPLLLRACFSCPYGISCTALFIDCVFLARAFPCDLICFPPSPSTPGFFFFSAASGYLSAAALDRPPSSSSVPPPFFCGPACMSFLTVGPFILPHGWSRFCHAAPFPFSFDPMISFSKAKSLIQPPPSSWI